MGGINLAPGVEFDEEKHEYWKAGRRLSGVTGLITKKLRLSMPDEYLEEHQIEGIHIHQATKQWIDTGESGSVHPGVAWIVACFLGRREGLHGEVLVSDGKRHASSVDIVDDLGTGELDIYDIKKGVFKRDYCSWQLSIYKYFIETFTVCKVRKCEVLCVKDKEIYPIFTKDAKQVEELLYGGG
jgi:hypothetical protein